MRLKLEILSLLLVLLGVCSCREEKGSELSGNGVYYWRTSFSLSEAERKFLADNDISTLYVKFFDVIASDGQLRPSGTLRFNDTLPRGMKIVPTVFIEPSALAGAAIPEELPQMIVSRIDSMCVKNGYSIPEEIQLDFDWTASNRTRYFALLEGIGRKLHAAGRTLSATIRLHQLSQPAPPADYGVLMVYNTGKLTSPAERNSILSTGSVKPYLKYLKAYNLPLASAFPIYSWNLLFHDGKFTVIARGINHSDTTRFAHVRDNLYAARRYMAVPSSSGGGEPGARIIPGDILRHEEASAELLDSIAAMLKKERPEILSRIILYHLDEQSINNYTTDEIKQIYTRP